MNQKHIVLIMILLFLTTSKPLSVTSNHNENVFELISMNLEANWTQINTETSHPRVVAPSFFYDSYNDWVVMFGGRVNALRMNETWIFDYNRTNWLQLDNISTSPSIRSDHRTVYSPVNNTALLFGGTVENDTDWLFDSKTAQWSEINSVETPEPRIYFGAVYDSKRNRALIFGGHHPSFFITYNDLWEFDFNTNEWTEINDGLPPGERDSHGLIYNPNTDSLMSLNGVATTYTNETWEYDIVGNSWTQLTNSSFHDTRLDMGMIYHTEFEKIILFGGTPWTSDLWMYDRLTEEWSEIGTDNPPQPRYSTGFIYIPSKNHIFMSSGRGKNVYTDTWILTFDEVDLNLPTVSSPSDIEFFNDSIGNSLIWKANDSDPANYEIYRDQKLLESGMWGTNESFIQNLDGLKIGVYNYTFWLNDTQGHESKDEVIVKSIIKPIPSNSETTKEPSNTEESNSETTKEPSNTEESSENDTRFYFPILLVATLILYRKKN